MISRKERRAAEHAARKTARKAGFPYTPPQPPLSATTKSAAAAPIKENEPESFILVGISEPGPPFPLFQNISPAKLAANRANAQHSTGAKSPETQAISAQNHTTHGLARHHNGNFKILTSEDPQAFEALKQSLIAEHNVLTPTESILVHNMAESHWLAQRAQRLQDLCIHPDTGAVTDEKNFSLYTRYKTTHTRAFHKCLNDLLKLRGEKRKADLGFEAQKVANERHEMRKQAHYWEVLKKDALACRQLSDLAAQNSKAREQNPAFDDAYEAELAKRGLEKNSWEAASQAA